MRSYFVFACFAGLTSLALAQQPAMPTQQPTTPTKFGEERPSGSSADSAMKDMFEAKIKAEWEALKNKDKKAYADLLADDYQGVEVDGRGERNKIQAINELADTNVFNYTLFGFKRIPAGPDAALVIYEVTMEFPPKSVIRYSRVYISEFWVKRAGQWKVVHYQETHVK
jgi:ketosteroid isomerase-like protein